MTSGIYAVANFGAIQLYVGEVRHMKSRWPKIMEQLERGNFPEPDIQQEWLAHCRDRRFTFHTAEHIQGHPKIRGRKLFMKDVQKA